MWGDEETLLWTTGNSQSYHILVFVQFAQKISFNLKISPNFSPMWVPFLIDFPLIASVPY
jgi:hypothetical protein